MKSTKHAPNRTLRALAGVALTLSLFSAAPAQQASGLQSYEVELVIFQHLGASATPEEWGLETGSAGGSLAIPDEDPSPFQSQTAAPAAATASFPALPASKYKLTAIEETLRRSRNYRALAHFGWTQPGYGRGDAKSFPIATMIGGSTGLTGQIALTRGRYLHLTLDLTFEPVDASGQRFVLRQTRRMRSNERHYIDHPKFGVIAVITPAT